jgi:hypothetical protein
MLTTCSIVAMIAICNAAALRQIVIERTDPVIERKSFDPKDPPSEMPKLDPNEAAVTQSFFGADSRVGGEVVAQDKAGGESKSSIKVDTVQMTLRLRITVWLPSNANAKLTKHEDGHRQIAEHYYKDAEMFARTEAQKLLGQTISATGADAQAAGDNALKRAAEELGQRYLGQTDVPCGKAQALYDKLTAHGTNAVPEARAIAEAIAKTSAK